ncbi:L,D-transpeptidase family protein [Streptomyces seoulensis]
MTSPTRLSRWLPIPAAALSLSVVLTGCAGTGVTAVDAARPAARPVDAGRHGTPADTSAGAPGTRARPAASTRLPGLGPRTLAGIPRSAREVVLVAGEDRNSSTSRATLYRRTDTGTNTGTGTGTGTGSKADTADTGADAGWTAVASWPARNALRGWTDDHREGDLRSPIGVFTLTDAGGRLADPGTGLPYHRSASFSISGTGFAGEPLAGSFDYVVAIDYNRRVGVSPLDPARPQGGERGGGIWLHVDHGGPTHGCVALAEADMKQLLRALDTGLRPVIVMGDARSLAR